MKTIHIIQSQHANNLKKRLLSDQKGLLHLEVLSFDVAFKIQYDLHELMLESYQRIQSLPLEVLSQSALNPLNIKDYLDFIKEMKLYGLTTQSLPFENALQRDNKIIIEALFDLIPKPQIDKNTEYHAYDHFLSHSQKSFLDEHQVQIHSFDVVSPSVTHQKTLNIRHEFESVLQEVMNSNLDEAVFVIPSLNERLPLVETIMKRYGFDVSLQDRTPVLVRKKFLAYLEFIENPSQHSLIEALTHHGFGLQKNLDLIYLISLFNIETQLPESLESQNKDIQSIIDRSKDDYDLLAQILGEISFDGPFQSKVIQAYEGLRLSNQDDLASLKSYIEKYLHLYDDSTSHLFKFHYQNKSAQTKTIEHFTFYDLNDFSIEVESHVYAIDMSSKNYPAVSSYTGVLDESYRSNVASYPNLEKRTQHTLHNKSRFLRASRNLTLSYAYTNYEGKSQEASYELFGSIKDIPNAIVNQRTQLFNNDLRLGRGFVEALIMKNGKFNTSISALETYRKDPLQFFLRYVLKFYEIEYPEFGPLHLGNINHDALEQYLSGNPKEITLWDDFPKSIRIEMIQSRNEEMMKQNFFFIDGALEATKFKPEYFEHTFAASDIFKGFDIAGKIDRIDIYGDQFIIYDYKSSATSLSTPKIANGEQLQLLTYGFILEQILNKDMLGVYYYALRNPNILTDTYKFTRRLGIEEVDNYIEFDWIKKKQYMGFLFDHVYKSFDEALFHQRLTVDSKNPGNIKLSRQPFNKETTLHLLKQVYARFHKALSAGLFDPYQVRDALHPEFKTNLQKEIQEGTN